MQELQLPAEVVFEGYELYFSNYCNQPCPILAHTSATELQNDVALPPIVMLPMLALSLRSSNHSFFRNKAERRDWVGKLAHSAWDLLAKAYCAFDIDDAYFQGLCLLVQVDLGGKLATHVNALAIH